MMVFLVAILPGCQKKEAGDSEKFIKEFSLKSEDFSGDTLNVSYLKEEEIMEVLTNGTHVVLFAHAGKMVNEDVALLADLVSQYEGMRIYYFDIEKVDKSLANEIVSAATPMISYLPFEDNDEIIYFVKDGEIYRYVYDNYGNVEDYKDALDVLADYKKPGCSGLC
jgi:hypothetical protein